MKYMNEIETSQLINELAPELKKVEQVVPPSWAAFVRTGTNKERPPVQEDWWYLRAASVLVKIQARGPVGVSKLRTLYGGKKRRGHKPAEFRKASGNILRKLLQQLESAGLLKQEEKGVYKGRILTAKAKSLINTVAKASKKRAPKIPPQTQIKEKKSKPSDDAEKPKAKSKDETSDKEAEEKAGIQEKKQAPKVSENTVIKKAKPKAEEGPAKTPSVQGTDDNNKENNQEK